MVSITINILIPGIIYLLSMILFFSLETQDELDSTYIKKHKLYVISLCSIIICNLTILLIFGICIPDGTTINNIKIIVSYWPLR